MNIMQHMLVFIGHIWKTAIIEEDVVQAFASFGFWANPNWGNLIQSGGVMR
jgi:hypothetical protein